VSEGKFFYFFEILWRIDIQKKEGIFDLNFKHPLRMGLNNLTGADITFNFHDVLIEFLAEDRRVSPFAAKRGDPDVFIRRPELVQQKIYGAGINQGLVGEQKHCGRKGVYDA
jgi:hypothetical protein